MPTSKSAASTKQVELSNNHLKTLSGDRVAFVSGLRTPFAKQATTFKNMPALELGAMVVNEMLERLNFNSNEIDQLVFGQVVQMPAAPNIAREIVLSLGLPDKIDAYSVSRACATSFQAIANVAESIVCGHTQVGIAGGADSTSVLPIGVSRKLAGSLLDLSKARTLSARLKIISGLRPKDLLPVPPAVAEYTTGLSMGQTAEQMAQTHAISRQSQDELAHRSHELAAKAWQQGEIQKEVMTAYVPPYKSALERDNNIRFDSSLASYSKLRPAFDKRNGSVTAANSTPLTDGAAAMLLMSESKAKALGYPILGYLRSYAFAALGVKQDMLMGPAYATPLALDRAGLTLNDLDLIEMHEAFAAQVLTNMKMFGSTSFAKDKLSRSQAIGEIDMDKFNVNGGSIAYGHPFAATGARLITQTLNELNRRGGGLALTTACAAGGLGAAFVLEAAA